MADDHFHMRPARRNDLSVIVDMLANDALGQTREDNTQPLPAVYFEAFEAIEADANHELMVACLNDQVVGVLQLNVLHYLTHQGSKRALIEGVRTAQSHRSQGIGRALFEYAIEHAQQQGCNIVQLTTDKARPDALRFYEQLGFVASHEGMKLKLG
ncbi:MAG: GNAT family N-acetyltransferase [Pseudomonadota bacterium]